MKGIIALCQLVHMNWALKWLTRVLDDVQVSVRVIHVRYRGCTDDRTLRHRTDNISSSRLQLTIYCIALQRSHLFQHDDRGEVCMTVLCFDCSTFLKL